jgi:hypothetical protein
MTSLNVGDSIQFTTPDVTINNNSGALEVSVEPTTATSIATKQYVDNALSISGYVCVHQYAKGLAPSGTINTGTSGQLVLGTALPTTYSDGIWLYLPAIATTPAITAGFYYCIATNTTTLTIYDNVTADKQPYDFTVGAAFTGTTSEITMHSDTVVANSMGNNGHLIGKFHIVHSGTVDTKTFRWKFGGTLFNAGTQPTGTIYSYTGYTTIFNQNNTAKNIGNRNFSWGAVGALPYRGTIDTTLNQTLTYTLQKASATDYLISEGYCVNVDYIA